MNRAVSHLRVLLYSKYSPSSKRILSLLDNSGINTSFITPLCVDNEEVRKRVLGSDKLRIITVPCILNIYEDGGIEQYDGDNAFKWVEEEIRKRAPPPPPQPSQPPPLQPKQPSQSDEREDKRERGKGSERGQTSIDDLESEDEEDGGVGGVGGVSVERMRMGRDEEREERGDNRDSKGNRSSVEEEDFTPPKPPRGVRNGAGGYDIIGGEFGEMDEPNRSVSRGIKKDTQSKGGDLMAAAMAMQKSREREEEGEKRRM